MKGKAPARDRLVTAARALLASCLACIVAVHASLIGYKTFANVDEAYAFALGGRIVEGFKLYQGAISQRGPLMYYFYAVIAWMGGWDNIVCLRLWALAFASLHVGLVWWTAKRLGSSAAAILATLVAGYAMTVGLAGFDRFSLNGEYLQLPFVVFGAAACAFALRSRADKPRDRLVRLVAGGVAFGLAVSIKQSIAVHVLPVFVWVVANAIRNRSWKTALRDGAVFAFCLALPPAAFLVHAAANGTLSDLWFYCVTYNTAVHMALPWDGQTIRIAAFELRGNPMFGVLCLVVLALAAPSLVRRIREAIAKKSIRPVFRAFSVRSFFFLQALIGVVAAAWLRRFYPHYFIPAIPMLALALGLSIAQWSKCSRPIQRVLGPAAWAGMGTLLVLSAFETYALEAIDGMVEHDRLVLRVSKYIEATTQPGSRIFVWGFSPWLYQYSHRRPAGRYVFSTYVTGLVPFRHQDPEIEKGRIIPGSQEALLADLDHEKPDLVIDAGAILLARSMRSYEKTNAWLRANYCFEVRVRGYDIYRRKPDPNVPCAQPKFPQVQAAFNLGDSGRMGVPMSPAVDADQSYWLATIDEHAPQWFPDGPPPPQVELLVNIADARPNMRLDPKTAPRPPTAVLP